MTEQKVALGKLLFADTRLSVSGTHSCATCHQPDLYFTDGLARSNGALGEPLAFNTPTLINSAYSTSFSWIDKKHASLEQQHLGPLNNTDPVELGLSSDALRALSADSLLLGALQRAFPDAKTFTQTNLIAALASYVRSLIRGNDGFDRLLFDDDQNALTARQQVGLTLFNSDRLNCTGCHRGFLLSGPTQSIRASFTPSFYQTGVSGSTRRFRVPSLRFVQHTAPYMHDGSHASLEQVIEFYEAGGRGTLGANAQKRMAPFSLSIDERAALLAFLRSL